MKREEMLARVEARTTPWDIVIIGGGATGMGIAVDAATRGYEVLLLNARISARRTSSRSTKLVHGGVRYLEQGNVTLVMEALQGAWSAAPECATSRPRPRLRRAQLFLVGNAILWNRSQDL